MKAQKPLLRLFGVAGVFALLAMSIVPAAGAAPRNDREIVGYFIEWGIYGRQYLVKDIVTSGSADKLTVINYAFANAAPFHGLPGDVAAVSSATISAASGVPEAIASAAGTPTRYASSQP